MELCVEAPEKLCEMIRSTLEPDNNEDIEMQCTADGLKITIRNLKISSLYNMTEDILRCYETSKKIMDGRV